MQATWNGHTVAESDATKEVEGNHYFPPESLNRDLLKASGTHTTCPWKGEASYYHLVSGDERAQDAAWYYPNPKDAARSIKGYVAFYGNTVAITD